MAIISVKIKTINKAANNVSVRGSFSPFLFLFVSKKGTFYLSVNVFSTKVLNAWGHYIFTSPNGDGTAILRGHPSHGKVSPLAVQREYLHFSVIFKTLSIGPAPGIEPATSYTLQSSALLTELILPRLKFLSVELFTSPLPLKIP